MEGKVVGVISVVKEMNFLIRSESSGKNTVKTTLEVKLKEFGD